MWSKIQVLSGVALVCLLVAGCGGVGKEAIGDVSEPVDVDSVTLTVTQPDGTSRQLDLSIKSTVVQAGAIRGSSIRSLATGYGYGGKLKVVPIDLVFAGLETGRYQIDGKGNALRNESGITIAEIPDYGIPALESKSGSIEVVQLGSGSGDFLKGNFEGVFTDPNTTGEYVVQCTFSVPY
ncbi:MAG: hypothetical protein KJ626_12100 [Verrucomicrobia bacterium]|nr:hypothetical protein [Verrucomicrobiota bacterium]